MVDLLIERKTIERQLVMKLSSIGHKFPKKVVRLKATANLRRGGFGKCPLNITCCVCA